MSSKGSDPMEVFVGLALRVLVAAVVLGVAFQVCEAMGPVARAIACACGVAVIVTLAVPLVALGMGGNLIGGSAAVMVLVPEVAFLASLGNRPGT